MNPLELYLQRVAHELRYMPAAKRDDELRELRSHLEQRTQDFTAQGVGSAQAQTFAINEFGAPRTLGAKLCDAWEGVPFSPKRLFSALGGVTLFWICGVVLLFGSMTLVASWRSEPYPAWQYGVLLTFTLGIPFWSGWLFSHWLGRRGPAVTFLYFATLFLLFNANLGLGVITGDIASIPLPIWNTLLATGGAIWGQTRRKRFQRLALADGRTWEGRTAPAIQWPLSTLRLCLTFIVSTSVLTIGIFYGTQGRRLLRPLEIIGTSLRLPYTYSTIEHSMHQYQNDTSFQPPYVYSRDFFIPLLRMRELPPITAAEREGQEKRVYFFLEIKAQKQHAARRIAFLKRELASPQGRQKWGETALRDSLARVQSNDHQVQGIARLVQTPNGWEVDEESFDRSRLWAWCNDIRFNR